MISRDAFFTAVITLTIFYATMYISLAIEKKKDPTFDRKNLLVFSTALFLLLMLATFLLYFWENVCGICNAIGTYVREELQADKQQEPRESPILLFIQNSFSDKDFQIVYIGGAISLLAIWIAVWVYIVFAFFKEKDILSALASFSIGLIIGLVLLLLECFISRLVYLLQGILTVQIITAINCAVNLGISLVTAYFASKD